MFHVIVCVLCLVLAAEAAPARTGFDTGDSVLLSYELTPEQEKLFSHTDGAVSRFWEVWSNNPLRFDHIYMSPEINGFSFTQEGFENEQDCNLTIRSAYGEQGLYLYIETQDDTFMEAADNDPYNIFCFDSDCFEYFIWELFKDMANIYLDIFNSSRQNTRYLTPCNPNTATSVQFQYSFGKGAFGKSQIVGIHRFNPEWNGSGDPVKYRIYSVADVHDMGILFELITICPDRKIQEWLIPWTTIDTAMHKPKPDQRIAAIFYYTDCDIDSFQKNRWHYFMNWKKPTSCQTNMWGDIEFSGPLVEKDVRAADRSTRPATHAVKGKTPESRSVFYFLDGKRLGARQRKGQGATGVYIMAAGLYGKNAVPVFYPARARPTAEPIDTTRIWELKNTKAQQ